MDLTSSEIDNNALVIILPKYGMGQAIPAVSAAVLMTSIVILRVALHCFYCIAFCGHDRRCSAAATTVPA